MVLQSPVEPVMEHRDVTLHCKRNYSGPSSADFFRHTRLVGTSSAGHMTIHNFSKADEGAYKCRDSEHIESPPTWLLVHGELLPPPPLTNDVGGNVQGQRWVSTGETVHRVLLSDGPPCAVG